VAVRSETVVSVRTEARLTTGTTQVLPPAHWHLRVVGRVMLPALTSATC
jgi:hypothetical protein